MRVIAQGRKTSRTTSLIERADELESKGEPCYIVCHSEEEARRVFMKAQEMKKRIAFPITFKEFMHGQYYGKHITHFLIDNADYLLQSLTAVNIDTIVVHKEREVIS